MILIGIAGLARSGKDTAAAYLAKELGLYQYAFAEPLKTMLKSVFGDHFHVGDRSGICPEAGVSYRSLMQTLGTEWGRQQVNPDLWVNLVQRKWCQLELNPYLDHKVNPHDPTGRWGGPSHYKGMILSDVRFDSEASWIRDMGGVVLQVDRDHTQSVGDHPSEAGVSERFINVHVVNNGTLDDLYQNVWDAYTFAVG